MLRLGIGKLLPNFNERTGYVGILPLLFALYAMVGRRCRVTVFYASAALVALVIIYGLPPLPALLGVLPVLRDINPTRLLMVLGFSLAVLAGLGWDRFQRGEDRRLKFWVVGGFWLGVGLVLLWYWHRVGPRWNDLDAAHRAFLQPQFFMLAGALVASGFCSCRRFAGSAGWAPSSFWAGWPWICWPLVEDTIPPFPATIIIPHAGHSMAQAGDRQFQDLGAESRADSQHGSGLWPERCPRLRFHDRAAL